MIRGGIPQMGDTCPLFAYVVSFSKQQLIGSVCNLSRIQCSFIPTSRPALCADPCNLRHEGVTELPRSLCHAGPGAGSASDRARAHLGRFGPPYSAYLRTQGEAADMKRVPARRHLFSRRLLAGARGPARCHGWPRRAVGGGRHAPWLRGRACAAGGHRSID